MFRKYWKIMYDPRQIENKLTVGVTAGIQWSRVSLFRPASEGDSEVAEFGAVVFGVADSVVVAFEVAEFGAVVFGVADFWVADFRVAVFGVAVFGVAVFGVAVFTVANVVV